MAVDLLGVMSMGADLLQIMVADLLQIMVADLLQIMEADLLHMMGLFQGPMGDLQVGLRRGQAVGLRGLAVDLHRDQVADLRVDPLQDRVVDLRVDPPVGLLLGQVGVRDTIVIKEGVIDHRSLIGQCLLVMMSGHPSLPDSMLYFGSKESQNLKNMIIWYQLLLRMQVTMFLDSKMS